jgi:hypothetical protein
MPQGQLWQEMQGFYVGCPDQHPLPLPIVPHLSIGVQIFACRMTVNPVAGEEYEPRGTA